MWAPELFPLPFRSFQPIMASSGEQEEVARLWKVNRTIHELVKDRVSLTPPDVELVERKRSCRGLQSPTTRFTWTSIRSGLITQVRVGMWSEHLCIRRSCLV